MLILLLTIVTDTGLRVNAYADVITAAKDLAKEEGLSLAKYLAAFAINNAGIRNNGVVDDD